MTDRNDLIGQQIEYYRARAGEYDEWFLRQGRYDRGEIHRKQWHAELAFAESALLDELPRGSDVLELACGTGLWTASLAKKGGHIDAIDASPEALATSRKKTKDLALHFIEADIFRWEPTRRYDFIFFGFWLSHVPVERFAAFWNTVARALAPDGKVFFVDSLFNQDSTARNHEGLDRSGVVERRLNDGSTYRIVKRFYDPHELMEELKRMGWAGAISTTGRFFFYGGLKRIDRK